ncbi:hypothetical protein WM40_17395 [Robbsia andropogonis]|uniref:Uncharacterized protein n=1 Tax=Robbsia andropogonis TaxID=28092 RepID=A0A0F5JX58_9BURK|nr:hypothetical protein [Robbsia andropogonis]KKB62413.1 hypothetical protein WM40_17395 [Robbsia andropogonis]
MLPQEKAIRDEERRGANRFVVDINAPFKNKLVSKVAKRLKLFDKSHEERESVSGRVQLRADLIGKKMRGGLIHPGREYLPIFVTPETRRRALAIAEMTVKNF